MTKNISTRIKSSPKKKNKFVSFEILSLKRLQNITF